MILIKPSFEIIEQESGFEGVLKQIEKVGRTCYKSEDKIKEGSAKKFVDMLTTNCHGAMLEHGTVYLTFPGESEPNDIGMCNYSPCYKGDYTRNKYSKVNYEYWEQEPNEVQSAFCNSISRSKMHVTTNYRVLVENGWLEDLKYQCEPTEYHAKRITVKFVCDRGVSHEFVRHRVFSFAQESTRYCNYSKNKFGNNITYIIPNWCNYLEEGEAYFHDGICFRSGYPKNTRSWTKPTEEEITNGWKEERLFLESLDWSERLYLKLIEQGWKPQQARDVLPNSLKTELVMTGFIEDWKHFFELRCDTAAHPQARELAVPLQDWFKENNLID